MHAQSIMLIQYVVHSTNSLPLSKELHNVVLKYIHFVTYMYMYLLEESVFYPCIYMYMCTYMLYFYIQRDTDLESGSLPVIGTDDMISHTFLVIYRPDSQVPLTCYV